MKIDNLAREDHDICPSKYELRHRQHWSTRVKSSALSFGGVTHLGIGAWYRAHDPSEALMTVQRSWTHVPPADDFRTLEKCLRVMAEYIKEYPTENWQVLGIEDGAPLIEKTFTIDTGLRLPCVLSWLKTHTDASCGSDEMPAEGQTSCTQCNRDLEPIEYGGIIDLIATFSGSIYIIDHKTTTRMGENYFLQFKPDNQMTGYIWGASKLTNRRVAGALINAVGIYKSQATKFRRQLTTRSEDDIAQWLRDLHMKCVEIKMHERLGEWPMRTKSCMLYGRCEYHTVHSTSDRPTQLKILEQQYVKRPWDYEARDENESSED
jgi:hypothetical protein